MKTILVLLLLCATTAYSQQKESAGSRNVVAIHQCTNADDDKALRQIAETWKDAYNKGNSGDVAALYSEDAYYLTQHYATGIVHGRAMIRAYVKIGTAAGYRVDKIDVLESACSGDFAYVISRYEATNAGQKVFGVNLLVLKKINERGTSWRMKQRFRT